MATHSHSVRTWAFKLTGALVIAACVVAVPTIILASQPARPAAPFGVHLTEAEFAAAKCYALRAQIEARTDPAAVSAWSQKYNVDAEECRGILAAHARKVMRIAVQFPCPPRGPATALVKAGAVEGVRRHSDEGNMHTIDTDNAQW
jgi:hypothetical protein